LLAEVDEPAKATPNHGHSPVFRGAMKSLVAGENVYIRNGDGVEELYDLKSDPDQAHDLSGTPQAHALLVRFRDELERLLQQEPPLKRPH
jgi:hypothetical protein